MPPKAPVKAPEQAVPVKEPERLQSEGYISRVLDALADDDLTGVVELVRAAEEVRVTDHVVDMRSSILVDFWFEQVVFAAGRGWSEAKAAAFIADVLDVFQLVARSCDVCEAKIRFKTILAGHHAVACDSTTAPAPQQAVDVPPPEPVVQEKGKGKKTPTTCTPPSVPQAALLVPVIFTIDDLAAISEFVTKGLFQHCKLYQLVFNGARMDPVERSMAAVVQLPMQPAPLSQAHEPEKVEQMKRRAEKDAAKRIAEMRQEECKTKLEHEAEEEAKRQELLRAKEEEEEELARKLHLKDEDAKQVLEAMQTDVKATLQKRQEALLERLAKLEAARGA
ncbi:hypothetical protein DIPPA_32387 [Diplonema papillatum]|nr:hypothetical protein DIPPA_32387 [Diplonema papillatum]